jgi:hypothetical protein
MSRCNSCGEEGIAEAGDFGGEDNQIFSACLKQCTGCSPRTGIEKKRSRSRLSYGNVHNLCFGGFCHRGNARGPRQIQGSKTGELEAISKSAVTAGSTKHMSLPLSTRDPFPRCASPHLAEPFKTSTSFFVTDLDPTRDPIRPSAWKTCLIRMNAGISAHAPALAL